MRRRDSWAVNTTPPCKMRSLPPGVRKGRTTQAGCGYMTHFWNSKMKTLPLAHWLNAKAWCLKSHEAKETKWVLQGHWAPTGLIIINSAEKQRPCCGLRSPPLSAVLLSRWLLTQGCVLVGHCSNVLAARDEVAAVTANQTAAFSKFQPISGRSSLCPQIKPMSSSALLRACTVARACARAYASRWVLRWAATTHAYTVYIHICVCIWLVQTETPE